MSSFGRKLAWAENHIARFDAVTKEWVRECYRTFEETDSKGMRTHFAYVTSPVPEDLALIAGDAAQCLRNALDHLAFAIACKAKPEGLTKAEEEASQFPIQESLPVNNRGVVTPYRGISTWPSDAQAAVELMQPYHCVEGLNADPLWLLRDLTNRDKHREVALHVAGLQGHTMSGRAQTFRIFDLGPIGTEPVALYAVSTEPGANMSLSGTTEIFFAEGPLVGNRAVVYTLRWIKKHIETVVVEKLSRWL